MQFNEHANQRIHQKIHNGLNGHCKRAELTLLAEALFPTLCSPIQSLSFFELLLIASFA